MYTLKLLCAKMNSSKSLKKIMTFAYRGITKQNFFKNEFKQPPTILNQEVITRPHNKLVGGWFLGCAGMVYVAVALGGVTRLTESGLSMVSWKFIHERWPKNDSEWIEEFSKYKEYPEYKWKNMSMTLEEFKFIFMMEYAHRMWGRAIGTFFFIPAFLFWRRGYFSNKLKRNVSIFGALICFQGLMGWYMVKSGLENKFNDVNDVPRVSQYRLASHLGLAFILYISFLSSAFSHLKQSKEFINNSVKILRLKKLAVVTYGLILFTALSGAFVAGLDAGLVYNSFPKMGDKWIPEDTFALTPFLRNFTENPTTVQFDHRILGISTLSLITLQWFLSRRTKLPKNAYIAFSTLTLLAWTQATFGVLTLLNHVPVHLAAIHQSGSLILLTVSTWLVHELRLIKYLPK